MPPGWCTPLERPLTRNTSSTCILFRRQCSTKLQFSFLPDLQPPRLLKVWGLSVRTYLPILLEPFIQTGLLGIASQITGGYVDTIFKSKSLENMKQHPVCCLSATCCLKCWLPPWVRWRTNNLGRLPGRGCSGRRLSCFSCTHVRGETLLDPRSSSPAGTAVLWARGGGLGQNCSACISLQQKVPSLKKSKFGNHLSKIFLTFYMCEAYHFLPLWTGSALLGGWCVSGGIIYL